VEESPDGVLEVSVAPLRLGGSPDGSAALTASAMLRSQHQIAESKQVRRPSISGVDSRFSMDREGAEAYIMITVVAPARRLVAQHAGSIHEPVERIDIAIMWKRSRLRTVSYV